LFHSKSEKFTPVASLVSVHHLRPRAGLVGPVSVLFYQKMIMYELYYTFLN